MINNFFKTSEQQTSVAARDDIHRCNVRKTFKHSINGLKRPLLVLLGVLGTSGIGFAQDTKLLVADPTLGAGPIHRFLMGADYRDLWAMPVEIEILDLSTEAGGLKPLFRVGGAQTFGLALKGADGKAYTFRSLVKNQDQNLHESLRGYAIGRIFQDQQASLHPAATSMVPPLAKAAGVLHNNPRLIVLPDDPALGEFRELFAGRLGTIEEFPTKADEGYAGYEGATDIIKSFEIVTQWLEGPDVRIDAVELLRLRLFDFYLGDWDRHANNHRWAKLPGKDEWHPVPEDRDQAFVDFQGLLPALARPFEPRLLRFEKEFPSNFGLTSQGWPIHRWFLSELDRNAWIDMANELQSRITDASIDEAVSLMPEAYKAISEAKLASTLKARRDKLPEFAERMYRFMTKEVDIQGTNKNEHVQLTNLGDGQLQVTMGLKNGDAPYFNRILHASETNSLRIYLAGGQNTLACDGLGRGGIHIDVVGSDANDTLQSCEGANLRFTETEEIERRKKDLRVAPNPLATVGLPSLNVPPESERPRDFGSALLPIYTVRANSNEGFVIGGGVTLTNFKFGKNPFGTQHSISAAVAPSRGDFEANYNGTFQHWNPRLQSTLDVGVNSIRQAEFYGFGNDTDDDGDSDRFETEQTRANITAGVDYVLSPRVNLFTGVGINYSSIDDDEDTLLTQLAPIGVDDFGWVSVFGGFDFDTRDRTVLNTAGYHFRLEASHSPEALDSDDSFSSVEAQLAGYFDIGSRSLLALRAGGKNVSGDFPFQEAAYVGGASNIRGLDTDRFAGDASVYGNIEYRYTIGEASAYVAKAEYGIFAFADVGRVFLDGDNDNDDDDLHPSGGGGLSITGLDSTFILSLGIARSEERTSGVFSAGFSF